VALLSVEGVSRMFGGLAAVSDVSFAVEAAETVGIIGPNGAGKSTLFGLLSGALRPSAGRVVFRGADVTGWTLDRAAHAGVGRTHQTVRTFKSMTVTENIMIGAHLRHRSRLAAQQKTLEVLETTGLSTYADRLAMVLPLALRKRLEVARILATDPSVLLLDEMMSGLTPVETEAAIALVQQIAARGITVLLVEHVMEIVMPLSQRIVVLDHGVKIAEGTPEQVSHDASVIQAYLGDPV
jgi:branched-chain amino acid transport system ATP-binding protein